MRKTLVSIMLITSVALPAWAQTADPLPPEVFQNNDAVSFAGDSGDMNHWVQSGSDFVISQNKANGSIMIGYIFDKNGENVSAAMTNTSPLQLKDFINPIEEGATGDVLESDPAATELADAIDPAGSALPELVPQPGLPQQDNMLLEAAPESVRNALLAKLVERLTETKTQKEYEQVVLQWREEVRKTLGQEPAPIVPDDLLKMLETSVNNIEQSQTTDSETSGVANDIQTPTAAIENPVSDLLSAPAPQDDQQSATQPDVAVPDSDLADVSVETQNSAVEADTSNPEYAADQKALETLALKSRWFALGSETAPVVYVVIDPTCPYCAKTLADLEDDVMAGDLQIRVVLAGLLSPQAIETVAGILLSDTPAKTLFDNARARAGLAGQVATARNVTDLPPEVQNDLNINRQNVIDLGIKQVPFFVWQTETGYESSYGVPVEGEFDSAISEVSSQ